MNEPMTDEELLREFVKIRAYRYLAEVMEKARLTDAELAELNAAA